jgi:hypothetical protein
LQNTELTSRFITQNDYLDLKGQRWEPSFSPVMVSYFQRYLNALALNSQMSEFPDDLVRTQGSLIIEAISIFLGGNKLQWSGSPRGEQSNSDDPVAKRLETARNLIREMQGMGAQLGSVRPEFLQSRADFIQLMKLKVTK